MMGSGDWRKLENKINQVLVPLGERVEELEEKVKKLEAAKAPAKPAKEKAKAATAH
jgi:BMFP domain-containing protein YqiC